jgi:hypothetical protein
MFALLIFLLMISRMVFTASVGFIYEARLISTNNSTLLSGQSSPNACLCSATHLFNYSNLFALNYFSSNKSCTVIISMINSPQITSDSNCTLILPQPLPMPCCSDLTWLLKTIQQASSSTTSMSTPTYLSIAADQNLLSAVSYHGSRTLFNRTNLTIVVSTTSAGSDSAIAFQDTNLFVSSKSYEIF